ncbi:MAG: nucleotide exchange factor GrpE [Anaerolineales bacterium]|jgi:molecular chaperone GrpE
MTDQRAKDEIKKNGMAELEDQDEPDVDSNHASAGDELIEVEQSGDTPESPEELTRELADTREKAQEYLDGWQRSRAEFVNYKKRKEKEQAESYQYMKGEIIKQYLEVIDDLERALNNRSEEVNIAEWTNGIELIYRKMLKILESEGVTVMESEDGMFNPNLHEAISSEASDEFDSGEIIEVVKKGYLINDRVLRPAQVRVAR